MKCQVRLLVTVITATVFVRAFEPVNGNGNGTGSFLVDAPAEIRERIIQAPSFEQAIDSLKALRQTNKQLRDYVDNPVMIKRLAEYYKKKPSLVATYFGTPAAQNWFAKQKKTPRFEKEITLLYKNLIEGQYKGINVPKALEWLESQMPRLKNIKEQEVVNAVKQRDPQMLARFLDASYANRKSFPEFDMLIDDFIALKKLVADQRLFLHDDFDAIARMNATLKPKIQNMYTMTQLFAQNNAQLSPSKTKIVKKMIKEDFFDKKTKEILLRTQNILKENQ